MNLAFKLSSMANENFSTWGRPAVGFATSLAMVLSLSACATSNVVPSIQTMRGTGEDCTRYYSKTFNPGILFFLPRAGFTNNARGDLACVNQKLIEGLLGRGDEELQAIALAVYKQLPQDYQKKVQETLKSRGTTIEAQMAVLPEIVFATFEDDVATIGFRAKGQPENAPPEVLMKYKEKPAQSTLDALGQKAAASPRP